MTKVTPTADFGFALLQKEISAKPGENVLVSPVSVSTALGMTANGARGDTLAGMISGLMLSGDKTSFDPHNEGYQALLSALQGSKLGVTLSIANAIYAREGVDFHAEFLAACWKRFKATVDVVDFDSPETLTAINKWCADKTNEKITSILEEIDPNNVMYLLNAVYFKGEWSTKFDKSLTEDDDFQAPGGSKKHPLMYRMDDMMHGSTDSYQVVALPFGEAKRINLYVFLPNEGKKAEDLVGTLCSGGWQKAVKNLYESEGILRLPRFKVEYANQLNSSLEALGMSDAFSEAKADFSGMGDLNGLHITDVQHKTFASFDEEGGEAAAVTSVGMGLESIRMPWEMTVNRPFLAVLADTETQAILFAGLINNP